MKRLTSTALSSALAVTSLGMAGLSYAATERNLFRLLTVDVPILPEGVPELRILHVSDLHITPDQQIKTTFVQALAELEPDLVVNTGDNLAHLRAVPHALNAFGPLLRFPGVFVFGSNDYYAPRLPNPVNYLRGKKNAPSEIELPWRDLRAAFKEHGWRDLTHQREDFIVGGVRLSAVGVDDPHLHRENLDLLDQGPNADADLSLALSHSPEPHVLRHFAADGYDLALCGHTHGGQLCLPWRRPIVTNCGIDRTRASGLSEFEGMALHVSAGLGTSPFVPLRFMCPPSATLLTLTPKPAR